MSTVTNVSTQDLQIPPLLKELEPELIEWRRYIHQHPEEHWAPNTSRFVADKLRYLGIKVTVLEDGKGVVGTLRVGTSLRSIGLRADMDALPITERSKLPYKSVYDGCMHACGHDGHTAMLLGAAAYLAKTQKFSGVVQFVFQPDEEGGHGALDMISAGLFEKFPADAVYGIHNYPLKVNHFGVLRGATMSAVDFFSITVRGVGGHASMPGRARDPFVAANQLLTGLFAIPSRRFDRNEAPIISVTTIRGGGGPPYNVIPDTVVVSGTVRSLSDAVHDTVEHLVRELARGTGIATSTELAVEYLRAGDVTFNSYPQSDLAAAAAEFVAGTARVHRDLAPSSAGDDFSFMLRHRPGAYVWLGSGLGRAGLHSERYDFNDEILTAGSAFFSKLVELALPRHTAAASE